MKAIVLAAGKGERLSPITDEICKPMIKIAGKPILEYVVEDLENCGFDNICIVVGYKKDQIINHFHSRKTSKIEFVEQKEFKGTADAIFYTKEIVGDDDFLVYLSDTLIPNLKQHIKKMTASKADINLLSSKINSSKTSSTGNIEVSNNFVTRIVEKPSIAISNLAWAGVCFFRNNLIFELINNQHPSPKGELDITETMNLAIQKGLIIGNHTCETFLDTGTILGLIDTMKYLHKFRSQLTSIKVPSHVNFVNPVSIGNNCSFGKNNSIGPYVSIGDNVSIEDNVEIENSLILDNSIIDDNSKIKNSVVFGHKLFV